MSAKRLLLFFLLVTASPAVAQQGPFIRAGYAWNWAAPTNAEVRFFSPPRFGAPPQAWYNDWADVEGGSFAAGQAAWMEIGYRISERVGVGLGGRHVFAPTEQRFTERRGLFGTTTETIYTRKAENPFFLEPGIRLYLPLGEKIEAHFRAGVLLPLRHTIHADTYTPDTTAAPFWQTSATLRTRLGVGAFGGADVTADLGGGFGLFIQGSFGLLSLRARDETVLSITQNGDYNFVQDLTEAERVVEYGDYYETPGIPAAQRSRQPTYLIPFNFWSVEIGVSWAVGQ